MRTNWFRASSESAPKSRLLRSSCLPLQFTDELSAAGPLLRAEDLAHLLQRLLEAVEVRPVEHGGVPPALGRLDGHLHARAGVDLERGDVLGARLDVLADRRPGR